MNKPIVQITDWIVYYHPHGLTDSVLPEMERHKYIVLYGVPIDHPSPNGTVSNRKMIISSPVINMDEENLFVETLNTRYQLVGNGISQDELALRLKTPSKTYR